MGTKTLEEYQRLIENTIKTVINQYHRKPFIFFNEHGFHQYCYHIFYSKKEFSEQFSCSDGTKTNLVHPEYPSVEKFNRKEKCIDPSGKRASYDMAVLNPEFIKNNNMDTIANRNIKNISGKKDDLIAAIEFKFITSKDKKFLHEIEWDFIKLENAKEAKLKYMVVFSNTSENEQDIISIIKSFNSNVNLIYVRINKYDNKKSLFIKQNPEGWLK